MLIAWLRDLLDLPSGDFRWAFTSRWEYEQAGASTAWDSEPDLEALTAALADYEEAPDSFACLLDLAATGSVIAMTVVGEGYHWGAGTPSDPREAETWLRKAYELGSRRGLLSYGQVLYHRHDLAAAEEVFRKGAEAGWPEAKYWLAYVLRRRAPESRPSADMWALVEAAADAGHPSARLWLGQAMARCVFGVTKAPRGFRMVWTAATEMREAWDLRRQVGTHTT